MLTNDFDQVTSLSKTPNGHIYLCNFCEMIHFVFRNIGLALDDLEFESLSHCVEQIEEECFDFPHPHGRAATITFHKFEEGCLLVTEEDLKELKKLIGEAYILMRVRAFL